MPTYEYMCNACESKFETEQSIRDEPLRDCPNCHEKSLKRLISTTSFVLKGSGWAVDNYSSKPNQ
jgi:putative FmdB family regulatory protein